MKLTAGMHRLLPSDKDVAFFREHGWYIAPKVLSDDVMDAAVRGAQRYWAGERDWPMPRYDGYKDWKPGGGDGLRVNEFVALQNREIRALIQQPILGAIAARLVGASQLRLWESELVYKPPQKRAPTAAIGWHTDRSYWMTCESSNFVSAWIPFHACPKEMGPVCFVDGSHLWTELDHANIREFLNTDLKGRGAQLMATRPDARIVTPELAKGQISFHSAKTLHASDFNRSDRPRLSLAVHLQDGANRYRRYLNAKGELWEISHDRLCCKTADGLPDYSDPDLYPVLWSDEPRAEPRSLDSPALSLSKGSG